METSPKPQRSFIKTIFISPDEPRLRAGWRLSIQTLVMIFFEICAFTPLIFMPENTPSELLLTQIASLFAITVSIFGVRRLIDKRSIVSLGLKLDGWALLDVFVGFIIPFFALGLVFAVEWGAGWLQFEGFAWESDTLTTLVREFAIMGFVYVLVGWNEELLSRGYHLQTISSGLNRFWGVILSSAIFGIMHLANPNSESKWLVAGGILLAGLFLAFGYLRTQQLWLPIGLHIGWNFFEGTFFGFPVSGQDFYRLIRITVDGPELWTGGAFGPEAGLLLIPAILVVTGLIWLYTRGRSTSNAEASIKI